jgi:hypothetical protein
MGGRQAMGPVLSYKRPSWSRRKRRGLDRAHTPYGAKVAVKATAGSLVRLFAGSEKNA